ncbi:hypothetical protein X956_06280 [Trueperella pyogenes TP8]|nr:hypothetical protein X956_06280 [Trueperella pyogenes TP8]
MQLRDASGAAGEFAESVAHCHSGIGHDDEHELSCVDGIDKASNADTRLEGVKRGNDAGGERLVVNEGIERVALAVLAGKQREVARKVGCKFLGNDLSHCSSIRRVR